MTRFSSLISREQSSPAGARTAYRQRLTLLAIALMTMPMLLKTVLAGDTSAKISTERARELLSSPVTPHSEINFHGITNTPFTTVNETLGSPWNDEDSGEDELHSSSLFGARGRVRMNVALYPPKDKTPDTNSPQVQAWVAELDWSKVPNIPVAPGLADVPHFPLCPDDSVLDRSACWWDMMQFLNEKKLTATFFIVGSRVLEYPQILKEQVAQGHHIAMHTWSHSGLTTLTNQQIVAEIRWSEKIIRDVTGLTMKYVRPPYGDTDNRVREILRQMGYTTVIWSKGWDTNDWRMLQNQIQESEVLLNFQKALGARDVIQSSVGALGGPITLEHDLTNATVSLSKKLIPMAIGQGLTPMSIANCLKDITPYQRGSKLGPNGAREKINNGDGKDSYRGMPGMEEQDFNKPETKKTTSTNTPGTSATATGEAVTMAIASGYAWVAGLATVAWVMVG
ncbi:chitin deacetylase [Dissophora globulifera]|uniref:Chitin deacetylase n=1 Tax=Dissophora globulifera TaxID=979702 RepID=A0A9P6UWA4_9FUNG|nr:chitin deacetylase [Dissophora globulifera]